MIDPQTIKVAIRRADVTLARAELRALETLVLGPSWASVRGLLTVLGLAAR